MAMLETRALIRAGLLIRFGGFSGSEILSVRDSEQGFGA
jgi:hypothetical protein